MSSTQALANTMQKDLTPAQAKGQEIAALVDGLKDRMNEALPRHMTPDRMARICLTEIRGWSPDVMQRVDPRSLVGAVLTASQLGLEPGVLGQCHLVPYGRDVQLIIGYRGFIQLAMQSGHVLSIDADVVYEGDEFEYAKGLDPVLSHTPKGESDEMTHVWALARFANGGYHFEVMSLAEIQRHRKRFVKSQGGPWKTDFEAMAKKTVIRRLEPFLPKSTEMQHAFNADNTTRKVTSDGPLVLEGANLVHDVGQVREASSVVGQADVSEAPARDGGDGGIHTPPDAPEDPEPAPTFDRFADDEPPLEEPFDIEDAEVVEETPKPPPVPTDDSTALEDDFMDTFKSMSKVELASYAEKVGFKVDLRWGQETMAKNLAKFVADE